jgi:hypothetical protein
VERAYLDPESGSVVVGMGAHQKIIMIIAAALYVAVGATHHGGGVPVVALSGRLAARELLADMPGR